MRENGAQSIALFFFSVPIILRTCLFLSLYLLFSLLFAFFERKLTVETLERVVKAAGAFAKIRDCIRVSLHTCRHFYAQSQLKNGCDLYTLSKLLGHKEKKGKQKIYPCIS